MFMLSCLLTAKSKTSMLQSLPNEIFTTIAGHLDLLSLARLACTSAGIRAWVQALRPSAFRHFTDRFGLSQHESVLDLATAFVRSNAAVNLKRLPESPDWTSVPCVSVELASAPSPAPAGRRWLAVDPFREEDRNRTLKVQWTPEGVPLIHDRGFQNVTVIDARTNQKIGQYELNLAQPVPNSNLVLGMYYDYGIAVISFNPGVQADSHVVDGLFIDSRCAFGYANTLYSVSRCQHNGNDYRDHSFKIRSFNVIVSPVEVTCTEANWEIVLKSEGWLEREYCTELTTGQANENVVVLVENTEFYVHDVSILCAKTGNLLHRMTPFEMKRYYYLDVCLTRFNLLLSWNKAQVYDLSTFKHVGNYSPFAFHPGYDELPRKKTVVSSDGRIWQRSMIFDSHVVTSVNKLSFPYLFIPNRLTY
ncbi:hypothetical protein HDU84_003379 [Entophlyctis sp. JEL0112]|nr:hypothetical protein HDU84_003379 [Entophlyctis sp. JEL0112]